MKLHPSDLWRWSGTLARAPYVLLAGVLFLVKYNVDRVLYHAVLGERRWDAWSYLSPGAHFGRLSAVEPAELWPFACVALPFAWAGLVLTLRRLRSAGLSPWLVLLFFVPLLNVLLFVLLATLPEREGLSVRDPAPRRVGKLAGFVPSTPFGAAACAIAYTVPVTALLAWIGANVLGNYGWGLFFGLPFGLGLVSVLIYSYHEPRTFGASVGVALLSVFLVGVVLLGLAIEGVICLAMAAPIGATLAFLGGVVGHEIQRRTFDHDPVRTMASLLVALPLLMGVETAADPEPTRFLVRTAVEIDAVPAVVWNEVVAFAEIAPPTELLFRAGVAYPIRAEIEGHGVGAIRRCVFSTGAFVEPIEVWDEPRLLKFSVTEQPPAMRELTLWPGAQPPHLDDYLVSDGGQFLLVPLPGGGTRLEGTTWYSHRIRPERYWKPWSDAIIHKIHRRVLEHIRERVERG